jgi:hypothetical protein
VWAVGDRGPNLKVKTAVELYGLDDLASLAGKSDAKLMPRPDIGPELAQLRVSGDRVELVRTLRIAGPDGVPVSGLPVPGGAHLVAEPAFDLGGAPLPPDPGGMDTEGVAALRDGGFWVSDEFGPSLARLDSEGRAVVRLIPQGTGLDAYKAAPYKVEARLPGIAARRQINRGFEAVAVSEDESRLYVAFQSPLAHPDEEAHEKARHVRFLCLNATDAAVIGQYLYPLDAPESFRRDREKGKFGRSDIKVSEVAALSGERLLVLERGSETTKIYLVRAEESKALRPEHLRVETRPSVEEMSGFDEAFDLPVLGKTLLFSSDEAPEVAADLEGMAILSPTELLLVSDNDFGVEGAETSFWRLTFAKPVLE